MGVSTLGKHMPILISGIVDRRHTEQENHQSSLSQSLKRQRLSEELPCTGRALQSPEQEGAFRQGNTSWEQLVELPSSQLLHPTPTCPPCHSENRILVKALTLDSGSLGIRISPPTLANREHVGKLFNLSEPQFHHLSNGLNNNSLIILLGEFKAEPPCIVAQVVHCTNPWGHHWYKLQSQWQSLDWGQHKCRNTGVKQCVKNSSHKSGP